MVCGRVTECWICARPKLFGSVLVNEFGGVC